MSIDWKDTAKVVGKFIWYVSTRLLLIAVVLWAISLMIQKACTPPARAPHEVPVPVDSVRLKSQAPGEWWATELPDGTRCVSWYIGSVAGGLSCSFPAGPTWDEQVERGVRR